jgi:hypothetical protein
LGWRTENYQDGDNNGASQLSDWIKVTESVFVILRKPLLLRTVCGWVTDLDGEDGGDGGDGEGRKRTGSRGEEDVLKYSFSLWMLLPNPFRIINNLSRLIERHSGIEAQTGTSNLRAEE